MKSVVLLSSGLDSTINLFEAAKNSEIALALTFDYGQRAAVQELKHAKLLAAYLNAPHKIIELPWFHDFTKTALINREERVPQDEVTITSHEQNKQTARAVWVPNRNGIFLNIAAAYAEGLSADWVVPGFNIEEAKTFPDNSAEFLESVSKSFQFSTSNQVKVKCFTTRLEKKDIVKRGRELGVPFEMIWPCYLGDDKPCGKCESCQRYERAHQGVL